MKKILLALSVSVILCSTPVFAQQTSVQDGVETNDQSVDTVVTRVLDDGRKVEEYRGYVRVTAPDGTETTTYKNVTTTKKCVDGQCDVTTEPCGADSVVFPDFKSKTVLRRPGVIAESNLTVTTPSGDQIKLERELRLDLPEPTGLAWCYSGEHWWCGAVVTTAILGGAAAAGYGIYRATAGGDTHREEHITIN
jgi:hypothetical protein